MVWGMFSWSDMVSLIRLETTLTGGRYVSILSDHLNPFMSIVHFNTDLGNFSKTMRNPTSQKLLQSGSRSTLLNLDTSTVP
ncbi:uncharacterized protein TNCV_1421 [Trichonephila clavipes]|nr:uncharacterized protein TNCV_1421 [Trichonephila clavipes]